MLIWNLELVLIGYYNVYYVFTWWCCVYGVLKKDSTKTFKYKNNRILVELKRNKIMENVVYKQIITNTAIAPG